MIIRKTAYTAFFHVTIFEMIDFAGRQSEYICCAPNNLLKYAKNFLIII